ncbi:MAG: flagellar hook protein FlgE, partial [Spongiibacteraceae bacterium]|nr:flagellar hook protein FlgE [Spongiibacteraceae bacterium]
MLNADELCDMLWHVVPHCTFRTWGAVAGSGVLVSDIAQQFGQGNISFTDNSLDLAINGQGFFVLNDSGASAYTRAGTFGLDNQGFIVASGGARLQGYQATNGIVNTGIVADLQIDTQPLEPNLTQALDIEFNLDSRSEVPTSGTFDSTNPDSFNDSTSSTIYDSQGNPHVLSKFFVKVADNQWNMNMLIDDLNVGTPVSNPGGVANIGGTPTLASYQLDFNPDGSLAAVSRRDFDTAGTLVNTVALNLATEDITIDNWDPGTGALTNLGGAIAVPATSSTFTIDIGASTQFGEETSVSSVDQNGFAPGRLANVEVSDTGIIFARYTNGESLVLGQVALAQFANSQGLTPLGQSSWGQSFESGQPIIDEPQNGSLGSLQSGALEESNVELSEELVRLIVAQRNYQANAKTIETADTVTQAVINLR